jgi:murein DD-endopeptidase MepM/ murein hydrolase activator NlpD
MGKTITLSVFVFAFILFPARPGYASFASFFFKSAGAEEVEHTPTDENVQNLDVLDANLPPKPDDLPDESSIEIVEDSALLAEVGPMGTMADVADLVDAPDADQISIYKVRSGDTLSLIAKMFGVSEGTIRSANGIKKGQGVSVGTELLILPISGVKHTVKKGDTIASIAKKYGGDKDEIELYNDTIVDGALVVGTEIIIPNGEIVESVSSSKSTSTKSSGKKGKSVALVSTDGYIRPVTGIVTQWAHDTYRAIDIGAPTGTPVYASRGGTVIAVKTGWSGGYGNMIIIDHGNGVQSLYAHLSKIYVSYGQKVEQGENIGAVGSTGRSTGPHLHLEYRGKVGLATSLYQGAPSKAKK